MVERELSPQFPNRKGKYDAYPLKRMVATFDIRRNILQVSAHPEKTPVLMEAFSDALTGSRDNFEIRKPSLEQAIEAFAKPEVHKELEDNLIKIIELVLHRIPLRGNPSYMHLKGENLLETIKQLEDSDIHIIGTHLAELSEMTFECEENKRIKVNFKDNSREKTGDFAEEDEFKINQILSSWGV